MIKQPPLGGCFGGDYLYEIEIHQLESNAKLARQTVGLRCSVSGLVGADLIRDNHLMSYGGEQCQILIHCF